MTTRSETRSETLGDGTDGRAVDIDGVASMLACSRRQVERWKSAGRLPKPDFRVGRLPRWWPRTIREWIDGGGLK